MTTRRSVLAAGAVGIATFSAGCLDFALGNEPLSFHAEPVLPTDAALEETGFERRENEQQTVDESIEFGVEREVSASVWASMHVKEIELHGLQFEAAMFATISMPTMDVLGRSFSPIDDLEGEELLEELEGELEADEFDDIREIEYEETISLNILGESRSVDLFSAEMDIDGQTIDVVISLAAFEHGDDVLVLLGIHPQQLPEEGDDIAALMESVEHPA